MSKSMSMGYKISFTIPEEILSKIIGALESKGVKGITALPLEPSEAPTASNGKSKRKPFNILGRTSQLILGHIANLPKGTVLNVTDLEDLLKKNGWCAKSASPVCSSLAKLGKMERVGRGKVRIPK